MDATYVYAVIPTGDEVNFEVAGVGDNGATVHSIAHGDCAAVVSASPVTDYRGLKRDEAVRHLVAHQRVVERVMQDFSLLPVRFGTVLPSESWARRLLEQGEPVFRSALREFAPLTQMEIVLLWDVERVFHEISQEGPIVQLKAQVADRPAEETGDERVKIGQMVHASLARRRDVLRGLLVSTFEGLAPDLIFNPVMDDGMAANVAVLLDDDGRHALDERLEQLDSDLAGRLRLRCVGPLPPYSFATIEVQRPSFKAMDDARQRLGLGETATADEVKRAYRELARDQHPDLNQDDPEAEERMANLTHAYELVRTYVHSRTPNEDNSRQTYCSFDRRTVEETLLIDVRRQEADA
jgi:hypothetical protein